MRNSFLVAALLSVLLQLVGGCASSPEAVKLPSPVVTGKPTSLDFILVTTNSSSAGWAAETILLNDTVISGLRETQLFTGVSGNRADGGANGGIKVVVQLQQVEAVSDNSRDWFGGLAGQAMVVVQTTVSDLATGHPIEVFSVEGRSGKSAKSGTTEEAVQRAALQVVAAIVRLNAQMAQ